MKRNVLLLLSAVCFLALIPAPGLAQPPAPPAPGAGIEQAAKELGLEGKALERFKEMAERFQSEKRTVWGELRSLMSELEAELEKEGNEKAIKGLLDKLDKVHDRADALRRSEREEMKKLLTPRQLAKLITGMGRKAGARMRPGGAQGRMRPGRQMGPQGGPGSQMGPGGQVPQQGMPGGQGR